MRTKCHPQNFSFREESILQSQVQHHSVTHKLKSRDQDTGANPGLLIPNPGLFLLPWLGRDHEWPGLQKHKCHLSCLGTFLSSNKLDWFVFQGQTKRYLLCEVQLPIEINRSLVCHQLSPFLNLPINLQLSGSCNELAHSPLVWSSGLEAPCGLGSPLFSPLTPSLPPAAHYHVLTKMSTYSTNTY